MLANYFQPPNWRESAEIRSAVERHRSLARGTRGDDVLITGAADPYVRRMSARCHRL